MMVLPRQDAIAAFSGSTTQAYPLMLQMGNAVLAHRPALDGTLDLTNVIDQMQRVANSMLNDIRPDPQLGVDLPKEFATFNDVIVVGGFSRQVGLLIRTLRYEKSQDKWVFARVRSKRDFGPKKPFHIFGDSLSASRYHHLLETWLRRKHKFGTEKPFDFEPLEVLWDFVGMPESGIIPLPKGHRPRTVGGSVQAIRAIAGARAYPYVVRWGDGANEGLYLLGRHLLENEGVDMSLIEETDGRPRLELRAPSKWKP